MKNTLLTHPIVDEIPNAVTETHHGYIQVVQSTNSHREK
jgi:hypothetical protein